MNNYAHYTTEQFAADDHFQQWVFTSDAAINRFWVAFLEEFPHKREEVLAARKLILQLRYHKFDPTRDEVTQLWQRVKMYKPVPQARRNRSVYILRPLAAAAALALLILSVYAFYFSSGSHYTIYRTAFAESKTITLPDNSKVILNSNSALRFSNDWEAAESREVWLNGEAFFDVEHTADHKPFKVLTAEGLGVEVLGTTFNMYFRENETKVVLNTGKIQLKLPEDRGERVMMSPGDLIEYKNNSFSKKQVNPEDYSAWTEKKLVLDQTSLGDIIRMVSHNYGVLVRVEDEKLLQQSVSGSIPLSNAETLVYQLAEVFQLKAEKENNGYVMYE